ncbi:hypothetical protein HB371_18855 [Acinetobacter baumannii]|uniref:hypothetical protein n=1 Tax=Acinetobacter baumannii TaxID=470 RepID=UPI001459FB6F|nr:hypothetical protein [Acinetobacter baumannii]NLZ24026.1 hypothetical protein [Acinetobacter baumannii]
MASEAAARKKLERDKKRAEGKKVKEIWFLPENIKVIERFMKEKKSKSFEDAVNEIIKQHS